MWHLIKNMDEKAADVNKVEFHKKNSNSKILEYKI